MVGLSLEKRTWIPQEDGNAAQIIMKFNLMYPLKSPRTYSVWGPEEGGGGVLFLTSRHSCALVGLPTVGKPVPAGPDPGSPSLCCMPHWVALANGTLQFGSLFKGNPGLNTLSYFKKLHPLCSS